MDSKTAVKNGVTLLSLAFGFPSGSNNGSISTQAISYAAQGSESALNVTQSYGYDTLNKLQSFSEGSVSRGYTYNRWGNQWVSSNVGLTLSGLTPTGSNSFDASTNRLVSRSYDAHGNQRALGPFTVAYDAADVQKSIVSSLNGSASYEYDGEGRRLRKLTCGGSSPCTDNTPGVTKTVYVYDTFGRLVAEYSTAGSAGCREFFTADHLGDTRLITDTNGVPSRRYDYVPFGEGIPPGLNGRSSKYSVGYYPDSSDGSESTATNSGAQDVIAMTNGPIQLAGGSVAGAYVNPKSLMGALLGSADTGTMDINYADNYSKHEFTHLLGTYDKPGAVLSNTQPSMRPNSATDKDYRWGIREAVSGVNGWMNAPQFRSMRYGEVWEKASGYSNRTDVGAPFMW
jgi:hypothetical protein